MPWRENDYFIEHEVAAIAENLFLNDDSSSSDSGSSGRRESSDSSDSGVLVKKLWPFDRKTMCSASNKCKQTISMWD